jgi:hypothetical protein
MRTVHRSIEIKTTSFSVPLFHDVDQPRPMCLAFRQLFRRELNPMRRCSFQSAISLHASFEQCQSFWSFVRHVFHSRFSKRALTKRIFGQS